jgi:hypothetical protein
MGGGAVSSAVGSVMKEEVVQYRGFILLLFRVNDYVDLQSWKSGSVNGK